MNRRNLRELLADLEDICVRAHDAGVCPVTEQALAQARNLLWLDAEAADGDKRERDSVPPILVGNQVVRSAASEAFRNARKICKSIK